MANNSIGTEVKLEGEAKFRAEIKNITLQAKALQSEMKQVVSSFDAETSAQEKATAKTEVLNKQIKVQSDYVNTLQKRYNEAKTKLGETDNETLKLKDQLNKANTELNNMNRELSETKQGADGYEQEIKEAGDANEQFSQSIGNLLGNEKLQEFFSSASQKIAEFASSAMDAAKELDVGYDTIATKTGATGESLDELKGIANNIFGSMPADMADVGTAVGEVSTRFGVTGDRLEDLSTTFLKFARINNTDVNNSVDTVQKALGAFGLTTDDTERILNAMTAAGQDSGVSMDELGSALVKNAGAMSQLGLSAEESIFFIGRLEKSGVDSETALTGMSRALKNATAEGIPLDKALSDLEDTILNGTDSMDGLQASYELFGRSGDKIYNALKQGTISFKDISGSVEDYGDIVTRTYEATISPWDKTKTAMNNLKTVASDLAGNALSTLVPAIDKITDVIKKVADWFNNLSPSGQKVIGVFTAIGAGAAVLLPKVLSVVTTLKQLKTASDLTKSLQGMGGEMQSAGGSAKFLSSELGQVTIGVTAGIAAVAAFTEAEKAWRRETDENFGALSKLADENKRFVDDAERSRGALDDLKSSYSFNAEEIDRLSDRLIELNEKQSLTAEESEEYRVIVAKLEQSLPGFSGEIDESTGKLKDQTQATKDNIDALKEMARQQAAVSGMADAIRQSTEASLNQKKVLDNMREALSRMGASANYSDEQLLEFARNANTSTGLLGTLKDSFGATHQYLSQLNNALAYGAQAYDEYGAQITEADALIAEYGQYTDGATTSTEELTTSTTEAATAVTMSAEEMKAAYDQALQSAQTSLSEQAGLFQKFEYDSNVSLDSISEALQSQAMAYATWSANATAVTEDARYGTDANFTAMANTILNMGMQGASYLKTFVDAAQSEDGRLEQVLADFGAASTAQASQANVMEAWKQNLVTQTGEMIGAVSGSVPGMTEAAYQLGASAPTGTAQGMEDNAGAVESAAGSLGGKVTTAIENAQTVEKAKSTGKSIVSGIATSIAAAVPNLISAIGKLTRPIKNIPQSLIIISPSISAAGRGVAVSLANGIAASSGLVSQAANTLANAAKINVSSTTYNAQGRNIAQGFANGISNNKGLVESAAKTAAGAAKITVKSSDFEYIGRMFDLGIVNGMSNSEYLVKAKAKAVINTAIRAAEERAKIGSPSKEFARIGKMSVLGYANALNDGAGMVAQATRRMISIPDAGVVAGGRGGVSNAYSSSYGDIVVNVNGANVSDPARLADMVADRINRQVLNRKAAFA